ncbi:MAG: hypothetical protein U1E14_20000 [Geminicoccaceae bacterium]
MPAKLLAQVEPRKGPKPRPGPDLVERGRRLFEEETFGGNGRTCASCHPASNNFTLDPAFIATLPPDDPLFVAEFNPALATLEKPALMRQHALILENLDGFDRPGVMRSVSHTLSLSLTTAPDPATQPVPAGSPALEGALGWSGDGSPGTGTLRNFAIGAVIQHMPRTLGRQNGTDFRLPTEDELDALEAFQLSLGRQADDEVNRSTLDFAEADADIGRDMFFGINGRALIVRDGTTRTCSGCHGNVNVNNGLGRNQNRSTGVGRVANAPPCLDATVPGDGGYGQTPVTTVSRAAVCGSGEGTITYVGTELFNPPPLVEAADTGPFFHNNSATTLEEAIAFYNSDAFNDASPSAATTTLPLGRGFQLDAVQVRQLAAFLRGLNADENARTAIELIDRAATLNRGRAKQTLRLALGETRDAIRVLRAVQPALFADSGAVASLVEARELLQDAVRGNDVTEAAQARVALERARGQIVN